MDSSSSTCPQPTGLLLSSRFNQSQGPPIAQQPMPIALTSRLLRPSVRLNILPPIDYLTYHQNSSVLPLMCMFPLVNTSILLRFCPRFGPALPANYSLIGNLSSLL